MKKIKKIILIIVLMLLIGVPIIIWSNSNNKLIDLESVKTDDEFKDVMYDKEENIWDESVLGILTIEKIKLTSTVKEGTTNEILKDYIGHIEETSTYDGNVCLAGHNRGYTNSYFARLNELKKGDVIKYKTKFYDRIYIVDNVKVIYETDWSLLESTEENKLTLITCIATKKEQRLCVQATEMTCNTMDSEL